nr:MAG TPA: hypothetical protein [Caudoviricetes sp.]
MMIVRFQISVQVCNRPFTKRMRVIRGGERESLPRCFNQRGAGQRLLRSQILHRVHQLPRGVEHKPDNVPRDIFPNLNLRDTCHVISFLSVIMNPRLRGVSAYQILPRLSIFFPFL